MLDLTRSQISASLVGGNGIPRCSQAEYQRPWYVWAPNCLTLRCVVMEGTVPGYAKIGSKSGCVASSLPVKLCHGLQYVHLDVK